MINHRISNAILSCARECGEQGATIADISRAIKDLDIFNWSADGTIPNHTGGHIFVQALNELVALKLIEVEHPEFNFQTDKRLRNHSFRENEDRVYVKLRKKFSLIQNALGFSLTEYSERTPNSVIASPAFSLRGKTDFDVFVLMPFSERLKSTYIAGICKTCEARSLQCGRGDDFHGSDYVIDQIWTAIYNTDYIIADCTGQNANVFYELGICHLLGKDVLIITQEIDDIPFDLKHRRFTVYQDTDIGLHKLSEAVNGYLDTHPAKTSRIRR